MALRELSSLERFLGLKKPNKYSTQGGKKLPLQDLNQYLEDKVYLAGNFFTLADILMYYGIHHIVVELAVQEKERYLNITRWFDHIQHYPGVRHHLPPVVVLRNRVYPSGHY
ncbi:eukaryotic translation elongation factor 1 epsilon-1 [Sinocyclocheilus grahami]|uniref:eukaryotic translation elongation factor 1 epsilon-1 n=1 Tax=Sinocyclocheilus grahami TaxID=75366 RepID=UPI0007AC8EA8|nr:PREDICTED: eukaryotic translation elongation factor 1 epsilon-1 [Sinocyclocheilus grahami]